MGGVARGRLAAGITFTTAAWSYWLSVFPLVRRELRHWQRRARTIPDCPLRQIALAVQHTKRGNIEGSAAFAAFAPRPHRPAVVRAQLAFQAIYDYVDTLAEQPHTNPIRNARQLHRALPAALIPASPPGDYYRHHAHRDDGGYLQAITSACRIALGTLPSYPAVAGPARRLSERIVHYQSLNLTQAQGSYHALARWASQETPPETGLRWWETAASAGSSLGIFALMATAAQPTIHPQDADAIERAYFPWIGSLHSLLDSLIDQPEDAATEQHNLIQHYGSPHETAARLRALAAESTRRARALPRGRQHSVVLAGMASHYLSAHEAQLPRARLARSSVLDAMGGLAGPTMLVLTLRRAAQTPLSGRRGAVEARYLPRGVFLYRNTPLKVFFSTRRSVIIPPHEIPGRNPSRPKP
jgi:tetraprenyl-beta-curcumene synthase